MDTRTASRRLNGDGGLSSIQFVLAAGLMLMMFTVLANLIVVQYGRGAVRSAVEQGARAGSVGGVDHCESVASDVLAGLLGGAMSDGIEVSCTATAGTVVASAAGEFASWTPLTPDFAVNISTRTVVEP